MSEFLFQIGWETLKVFLEAAPYLLLGFAVAGLVNAFLPETFLRKYLSRGRIRPIIYGALFGVPLPLCSCSVLPTAMTLRKRGATKGGTVSFLISTPETGVDSIAVTWGLINGLMAFFRPLAAAVTAIVAGLGVEFFGGKEEPVAEEVPQDSCEDSCGCGPGHEAEDKAHENHTHSPGESEPWAKRLWDHGLKFAFTDLFDDFVHWLLLGLVLSGIIGALVPPGQLENWLGGRYLSMVIMLAVGIPLYVCASASTPIAAVLMAKGLSPGAALVFLLAGPATNMAGMLLIRKMLGRRTLAIYLGSIIACSLGMGLLLDAVYSWKGVPAVTAIAQGRESVPVWFKGACLLVLAVLTLASLRRAPYPDEFKALKRRLEGVMGRPLTPELAWKGLIGIAVAMWLSTGIAVVPPGSVGLEKRFGTWNGETLGPGWHLCWPDPVGKVDKVARDRVRLVEAGFRLPDLPETAGKLLANPLQNVPSLRGSSNPLESQVLTGDENLMDLTYGVSYRVRDAGKFFYSVKDEQALVRGSARAAILTTVARRSIDLIYTTERQEIEDEALGRLQEALDAAHCGLEALQLQLYDVHAPPEVHPAFRDLASAVEDRQKAINQAQVYAEEAVNLARGEAAQILAEGESTKIESISSAQGASAAFLSQVNPYLLEPEITRFRLYLETLEAALPGVSLTIQPGGSSDAPFSLWLVKEGPGKKGWEGKDPASAFTLPEVILQRDKLRGNVP